MKSPATQRIAAILVAAALGACTQNTVPVVTAPSETKPPAPVASAAPAPAIAPTLAPKPADPVVAAAPTPAPAPVAPPAPSALPPNSPPPIKYSFGSAPVPGYTLVPASARYSADTGFGFENIGGAFPTAVKLTSTDPLHSGFVTAPAPFFFSVKVPEGDYRVTVTLSGGNDAASNTTVRAELRRLMVDQVQVEPGTYVTKTFAVNVHKPPILDANGQPTGTTVRVKAREGSLTALNRTQGGEGWSWDDTLTLEFLSGAGGQSAVSAIEIQRDDSIHHVFVCGDSTVCDQPAEPFTSWGQVITRWIRPDFSVVNLAISGETAPAFYGENRMAKIVAMERPGDYVFVQFGHNDMKSTAANALASYKNYYTRFVTDTRSKGATPVIMTPVSRETFTNGKITNSFLVNNGQDDYPKAVREVAAEQKCLLIDLQSSSAQFYEALGPNNSQVAFANASEKTHHSDYGSYEVAKCVLQAVVDQKIPLADHLTEDWKPFDPNKPDKFADFKLPKDPMPVGRGGATPAGN